MSKTRLDTLLTERGLVPSRTAAATAIRAGEVRIGRGGEKALKPSQMVADDIRVELEGGRRYVSRGGLKLEAALDGFAINPGGRDCLDVGASTGGFTDCLLQSGAARVYAADVGYGQLDWKLQQNPRVVVMDRTNVRHLAALPEPIDLVTIDASFISLSLLLPAVRRLMRSEGDIVALVKPQFEVGKGQVGKGGVVRDPARHRDVLRRLIDETAAAGLKLRGLTASPILGPAGNREFLIWLSAVGEAVEVAAAVDAVVGDARAGPVSREPEQRPAAGTPGGEPPG